jgi:Flp pilus assembly protein TadD
MSKPQPASHGGGWPYSLAAAGLILAIALTGLLCVFPVHGFDIWWHLKTGELIVKTHHVPHTDPFTYTALGRPWITHEWLAEVIFYAIDRLGGIDALVIFKALLAALAIGLGAWAALLEPGRRDRFAMTALGTLLAAPLITPRAFERPHMLTAVFLGIMLVLLRAESFTGHRRWRQALIPLFLVWANIHSGFVLGLGLIVAYWVGEAISPRLGGRGATHPCNWKERGVTLAAAAAATLINPHHVHAFLYPFTLVARPEVRDTIVELRSIFHPSFAGALFLKALVAVGLVSAVLLFLSRLRIEWAVLLPSIVLAVLAVKSVRGVSEFSVIVPLLIGAHGAALGERRGWTAGLALGTVVLVLAGGAAALRWGTPMGSEPNRRIGLGVNPVNVPAGAVRFLRQERPEGEIFNLMGFGAYLIYALYPDKKVYIDGRLDVFPEGFIGSYSTMVATGQGWDAAVEKYRITTALVTYSDDPTHDRGLKARLRDDPSWVCVFAGDNALVYAHDVPSNARILEQYGLPFDPSLRSVESIDAFVRNASPADLERTFLALERMSAVAPEAKAPALVLGQILDRSGRSAQAVDWLRRVVALDPASGQARLFLAGALLRSGSVEMACSELAALLHRDPGNKDALMLLADAMRSQSRLDEAVRNIERAVLADPSDFSLRLRAGAYNAEAGRLARAREHFEEARKLRPGDPAIDRNLRILQQIESQSGENPHPSNPDAGR